MSFSWAARRARSPVVGFDVETLGREHPASLDRRIPRDLA
jgi:hypothetical protein